MNNKEKIELLEQIDQYIEGKLSQEEIDKLWKFFLQHPEWYDWFETELHLRSLMKKGKKPVFSGSKQVSESLPSKGKGYKIWLYAAAASILLVLVLQLFSFELDEPIESLAISEFDLSSLMGPDVMRSGGQTVDELSTALNEAIVTAYDGETTEAIEMYQKLLTQPLNIQQEVQIKMNLGILFYNEGEYELAKSQFDNLANMNGISDDQLEKSYWYLGNTLLNLDTPREAREAIYNAYNMDGRFQARALELLVVLDDRLGNIPREQAPRRLGD